jgi:hypothetical protein
MPREPGESEADFKARRCLRFAIAFRDQAKQIESHSPTVARGLREQARSA